MERIVSKVVCGIKSGSLIKSMRNHMAKGLMTNEYISIQKMSYLGSERNVVIDDTDYVRINALKLIADDLKDRGACGNVAELGVYQGGFAKYINQFFPDEKLYLFDTFEGFSKKDVDAEQKSGYSRAEQDFSDTNIDVVLSKMPHADKCVICKGWFPDSAKGLETERFIFVSIDADLYNPIYAGLVWFYERLLPKGTIFVHDFNNCEYPGAQKAVLNFCTENKIPYFLLPDVCGSAVIRVN